MEVCVDYLWTVKQQKTGKLIRQIGWDNRQAETLYVRKYKFNRILCAAE